MNKDRQQDFSDVEKLSSAQLKSAVNNYIADAAILGLDLNLYEKREERMPYEQEIELFKYKSQINDLLTELRENKADKSEDDEIDELELLDDEIRNAIVGNNVGLAAKEANEMMPKAHAKRANLDYDDLYQAGLEGLIKAVDKFDYTRGNVLSTYATWWIQASISRQIDDTGTEVRIPIHAGDRFVSVLGELKKQNLPATKENIKTAGDKIGLRNIMVDAIFANYNKVSLNDPIGAGKDGDPKERGELISDEKSDVESEVSQKLLREDFAKFKELAGEILTKREAKLLDGIYSRPDRKNIRLMSDELHITGARARVIIDKALAKLQNDQDIKAFKYLLDFQFDSSSINSDLGLVGETVGREYHRPEPEKIDYRQMSDEEILGIINSALTPQETKTLVARYRDGLSVDEIADSEQIEKKEAASLLQAANSRIKTRLGFRGYREIKAVISRDSIGSNLVGDEKNIAIREKQKAKYMANLATKNTDNEDR